MTAQGKVPALSIVTICWNEIKHIQFTIDSMRSQSFGDWECIFVDGGSKDGTLELLQRTVDMDSRFRIVRQTSKGISAAFNEGMEASRGKTLLFLNGGDALAHKDALAIWHKTAQEHPDKTCCFQIEYITEEDQLTGRLFPKEGVTTKNLWWSCTVGHQATFIPRAITDQIGGYSPDFKIAMDYEYWLRCIAAGKEFRWFPSVLALHREGGVSFQQLPRSRKEVVMARWRHLPKLRASLGKDVIQLTMSALGYLKQRKKKS